MAWASRATSTDLAGNDSARLPRYDDRTRASAVPKPAPRLRQPALITVLASSSATTDPSNRPCSSGPTIEHSLGREGMVDVDSGDGRKRDEGKVANVVKAEKAKRRSKVSKPADASASIAVETIEPDLLAGTLPGSLDFVGIGPAAFFSLVSPERTGLLARNVIGEGDV